MTRSMGSARTSMTLSPQLCAQVHEPSLPQAEQIPVSVCALPAALWERANVGLISSLASFGVWEKSGS